MIRRMSVIALWLGAMPPVGHGEVKVVGRVLHTGFPAGGGEVYRPGRWCSALVTLRNEGTSPFSGRLVTRQPDRDGDVAITETVVALSPDGQERLYRLDFQGNQLGRAESFVIRLCDEQGRTVPVYDGGVRRDVLPAPPVRPLSEETALVLDLSARPVAALDRFAEASRRSLKSPLVVARLSAHRLPDRGYALRGVQGIVWDAPDPARLQPSQVQALVDYVLAGGVLVVAAARTAELLEKSPLGPILPVTTRGTASVDVLQSTWSRLLRTPGKPDSVLYDPAITIARARARPQTVVLSAQDDMGIDVVTRGHCGSGVVIFVAVELRDLFQQVNDGSRFFKEVLGLLDPPDPKGQFISMSPPHDLSSELQNAVGFESVGGAFLLLAILFVGVYILLCLLYTSPSPRDS